MLRWRMILDGVTTLWLRWRRRVPARSWVPESPSALISAWEQARSAQTLGALLNLARMSHGLSLLQLQTVTGINATYLVKLEHNLVPQPSLFALVQIAEALDISLENLLARLPAESYSPQDLLALERRWRLCLANQPGNRNGVLMLEAIKILWARNAVRT